jgi:uncharacterized protein (DUF849 family)
MRRSTRPKPALPSCTCTPAIPRPANPTRAPRPLQLPIAAMAAAMGGNIRVGLEDSLWAAPGRMAASNAEQVQLARKIIEGLGLEVATPDEAREILDLKGGDKLEV